MSEPIKNPYKKGKSKLIAELMLEGWSNEKIYNHISDNKLDARFSNPVTIEMIYKVRTKFNQTGLTDRLAQREQAEVPERQNQFQETDEEGYPIETPDESEEHREVTENDGKNIERFPPSGRPEWNLLTIDQINDIEDPSLRMNILNYRSYRERIKQEIMPTYATSEQFDTFKTEIQENLKGLDGRLNDLTESISETIVETINKMQNNNPAPIIVESENPETIIPGEVRANPNELIELEGQITAHKMIGFVPKSLMLYDLAVAEGFKGNIADFVNTCINDSFKGRNIELAVIDRKVIS